MLFPRMSVLLGILFTFVIGLTQANTEKAIFWSRSDPDSSQISTLNIVNTHPDIPWITPDSNSITIPLSMHTSSSISWFLLSCLPEGQLFEVRVCWPASNPAQFHLDVFSPHELLHSPTLNHSLSDFLDHTSASSPLSESCELRTYSHRYLRITLSPESIHVDPTAVRPPVLADIILDPYVLNILPRSLVPTIVYIIITSTIAVVIFPRVWALLEGVNRPTKQHLQ